MKRYIALLLVVMLLLAACGTTQPPADGTTPSTSATTGSTEPDGTEATQDDTTTATEVVTQPTTGETTTSTESAGGSTEPSTKPTEPTKPTGGNSSTDGTEQPTTQPTQPTQQPTQPPTQPTQPTEGTKPSDPTPTVGTLTINTPANTTISVGETLQLDYTYTGNKSDLSFSVFDDEVLSINSSGVITGKAAGTSNVYVNFGSTRLGSVRIKVVEKSGGSTAPAAEKIVVDGTSAPWQCVAGNYMTLTAHAKTSGDPQTVTVTSSNTSVATVSHQSTSGSNWCTFKISCHGGGHTTITITSKDGKATASYSLSVASGYSCNPGSGQLTPEQFVSAVNGVMKENGATIDTSMGYRVATLDASQLTWSNARSSGEAYMREFWGNGKTRMGISYQGTNEDGQHVFHIHR